MKLLVIETLSPVHIGSGRQLMGGIEYLYMSKEDSIAVLDDKKILNLLGKERLDKWIAIINQNGSVLELLNNVDPALNSSKIALRNVGCGINRPQQQNSIREHLLAGNMKPTIPGSSLKGCIRTAWFRKEVLKIAKIDKTKMGKTSFNSKIRKEDFKWNQKQLNEELIGKDPNHDVFRLLRLDDYMFEETICLKAETLNQKGSKWEMKESVSQFIECIPQGSVSTGRLNIAEDLKKNIIKSQNRLPGDTTFTLEALFDAVNKQTLALLEKEIKLWSPRETDLPKESQYFLEELKRLREEAIEANGEKHTAIARLGFATGFDSITGGWQSEKLSTASMNELANAVRRKDYGDMPFPKSRRIVNNGTPVGFIRLTLMDAEEAKSYQLKLNEKILEKQKLALEEKTQKEAEELKRKEEARKPIPYIGILNTKKTILEGEVVDVKNGKGIVRFVVNDQSIDSLMNGLNNPDIGSIVICTIPQLSGGKIKEVNFKGYKK